MATSVAVGAILAALVFIACIFNTILKIRMAKQYPRTTGTITEIKLEEKILKDGKKERYNHIVIEYYVNDHQYTIKEKTQRTDIKTGDNMVIIYNPYKPHRTMYPKDVTTSIISTIVSGIAFIVIMYCIIAKVF